MRSLRAIVAIVLAAVVLAPLTGAVAAPAQFRLTVWVDGDGYGVVRSDPPGIVCGSPLGCSAMFDEGTVVTLTQDADPGSIFAGWGGGCSGTGTCQVTMTEERFVSGSFNAPGVYVERVGDGAGTVTSSPAGIDCGVDCYEEYDPGTEVTLGATASAGSVFLGWSGGCTGTGDCVLTMTQDYHDITASFGASVLVVSTSGDGDGVVSSTPAGITCGGKSSDCTEAFAPGTEVTLTATPGASTAFAGWTGDCAGAGTCVLTITTDHAVDAAFDTGRVKASAGGDGSGSVVSDPPGIDCPGDCAAAFLPGTPVTLTAVAADESVLDAWSGACTGAGACTVDAADDPAVTATFDTGRVSVSREGLGAGVITSEPTGIDCGADCLEDYLPGTTVTLTALPQAGGTFTGWSGDCIGTDPCVITLGDATVSATFNPAGTGGKIVWECVADVCVMDDDGTDLINLTADLEGQQYDPVLSPDGTRVAFSTNAPLPGNADGNWEIAIIGVDGIDLALVTSSVNPGSDPYHGSYDPSWSPDGARLTFASYRQSPHFYQVFVIDADGANEQQITPSDFVARTEPVWSPNGAKIAYTSDGSQADVYAMNVDGTGQANLTPGTVGSNDHTPAWSPDGTRFAFTTDRHYVPLMFNLDIYVQNADGTTPIRVTDSPHRDRDAAWSPDGTQIAFSSARGGTYDLWAVDAPPAERRNTIPIESGLRQVSSAPGADLEPNWGDQPATHVLKIKKIGSGSGMIKSKAPGIHCGVDCIEVYPTGTKVKLVARPETGSSFTRWSVPACGTDRTCVVTLTDDVIVRARFTESAVQPVQNPLR